MKKEHGITLIALIVTIIVLLILAGVAINSLSGSDNAMKKAKEAKELNEKTELYDVLALGINNIMLERGTTLDNIDNYYEDKDTFVSNAKIDDSSYPIEEYEYSSNIAVEKYIKKWNRIKV